MNSMQEVAIAKRLRSSGGKELYLSWSDAGESSEARLRGEAGS
jgi:hypothetical protein